MSKAGRELLIKFVFLLKILIDTIEKIMNAFWLGDGGVAKWGIQWMSWRNYPSMRNYLTFNALC